MISFGPVRISVGRRTLLELNHLAIPAGLTYLAGRNGAGKSTLLRTLHGQDGLLSGGTVLPRLAKTCLLPQAGGLVPHLSAQKNLELARNLATISGEHELPDALDLLDQIGIPGSANVKAKALSGGQQRALALGVCLIQNPDLIYMDEPTAGLDYDQKNKIADLILQVSKTTSVLLSSHDWQLFRANVRTLFVLSGDGALETVNETSGIQIDPVAGS